MDIRMANGSGRKALFIGITVGFLPVLITAAVAYSFGPMFHYLKSDISSFESVALVASQTSFHVVACLLTDLEILNSEIGRLAIASSMISNICSLSVLVTTLAVTESLKEGANVKDGFYRIGSMLGLVLFMHVLMRPIMHWIVRRVPEGTNRVRGLDVFIVSVMILVSTFVGQCLGQPPGMGPLILGLAVPPGPPLAETIEDKLETIVSYVFLPLFYVASSAKSGGEINYIFIPPTVQPDGTVSKMVPAPHILALLIAFLAFLIKILGTILPSMCSGVSFNDSLVLGLILASQGLVDLIYFSGALAYDHIDPKFYTILIYVSMATSGLTSVLVKVMYRSSMDHLAYTKRSIGDSLDVTNFQILACVYRDYNVPNVIKILEASNATDKSPISLYLLHLIALRRIAPPFLISHKRFDDSSIFYNRSKHIINAFRLFQKQNTKKVSLDSFSALCPCSTMHQDICSLAVDKTATLIILPFHRQFNLDGIIEANTTIRNVNSNVLKYSPCSVGILIDQRRISASKSTTQSKSSFHIALIFLGGADDREALTYGMRMVDNPSNTITVIRFRLVGDLNGNLTKDFNLDVDLLDEFKGKFLGKEGVNYIEEEVSDGFGILEVLREFADTFDLIMVGRQHGKKRKIFNRFTEWIEYPELGFMGDMLASSKLHEEASILVLQRNFQISVDRSNYTLHV
ncbi:hypothetical protein ACHQM5_028514 [Ranunculus cassubicifolius]